MDFVIALGGLTWIRFGRRLAGKGWPFLDSFTADWFLRWVAPP